MSPVTILVSQPCHRTAHQFKHAFYLSCSITKGKENRGCWNRLMQWSSSHLHCSDWRSDEITHTGPTCHKHLSASWRSPQAGNLFSPPPTIHSLALHTPTQRFKPWYSFQPAPHTKLFAVSLLLLSAVGMKNADKEDVHAEILRYLCKWLRLMQCVALHRLFIACFKR